VWLAALVTAPSLSASGMELVLPSSPRYASDAFDATVKASIVGTTYGMKAWGINLKVNSGALTFSQSGVTIDSIWGAPTVNEATSGSITTVSFVCNAPTNDNSNNQQVAGLDIPIMVVRATVKSSATAGTISDAVEVRVNSMINFGNNLFVENVAALVHDHRSGGSTSGVGELVTEEKSWVGLFAFMPGGRAVVTNTAPITGDTVSIGVVEGKRVSTRPADNFESATINCDYIWPPSVATVTAACNVQLPASADTGFVAWIVVNNGQSCGSINIVNSAGPDCLAAVWDHTASVSQQGLMMSIWNPFESYYDTHLEAGDTELNLIAGCSARYQWTQLWLRGGYSGDLWDLTPLLGPGDLGHDAGVQLTYVSAAAGTSRVLVEGAAAGSADVWLASRQSSVRLSLTVSSASVTVTGLKALMVTGITEPWGLTGHSFTDAGPQVFVGFEFEQILKVESDTAQIFAFAETSDGTNTLWPPSAELTATALTTSLVVSRTGSDPWEAEVAVGAERSCGLPVASMTWDVCSGVSVVGEVIAYLQLSEPVAVRITSGDQTLAPDGDTATLSGIDKPTSKDLAVVVDYRDPDSNAMSEVVFSTDSRTTLVSNSACGTIFNQNRINTQTDAGGCSGVPSFEVTAEVAFAASTLTSSPITVTLVRFSALSLQLDASPNGASAVTQLKKIGCTSSMFQRAKPIVTATLSNGETPDPTSQATYASSDTAAVSVSGSGSSTVFIGEALGSSTITADFNGETAAVSLSVVSTEAAISSVSLSSSSGATLYGLRDSTFGTTTNVVAGGTTYSDVHASSWLPATQMVSYSSGTSSAVEVGADGVMMLRTNHEAMVSVTAQSCNSGPSDSVSVAANLKAQDRRVDLGSNIGLQFEQSGSSVPVPVIVNVGSAKMTSFELVIQFDDSRLLASSYAEGVGGGSQATSFFSSPGVTLNDPVSEVKLVGDKPGSAAPSGTVQIVTLPLAVQQSSSGTTLISVNVIGLITCSTCDGNDDVDSTNLGQAVLDTDAAPGYVVLSSGRRLSERTPREHRRPPAPRRRATGAAEATFSRGAYGTGRLFGDTDGDCVFDVRDVRRASVRLVEAGAGAIPTAYGSNRCEWQQVPLDPTHDEFTEQNDAVYLLQCPQLYTDCCHGHEAGSQLLTNVAITVRFASSAAGMLAPRRIHFSCEQTVMHTVASEGQVG
jgi:hypothetical protein